ncbi:unnamed protein product [[Candida] boidinii]|uniref:Sphingoid long-chain base transporter RSB1 n=1 Tax=Candida boidinii TaxID=5477 RepID=A0A9W6WAV9_CANBO|nr:hypothetical protein B5S30_g5032 [[Candida] boidinii]OWB84074.1 hypothetical protein B5S33_g2711 [[Candida] boidinii]GME73007.1 unnamed protein product [[Candida] boidinii]GMG21616.1 unnamed protein product [[Candida] boidinii]
MSQDITTPIITFIPTPSVDLSSVTPIINSAESVLNSALSVYETATQKVTTLSLANIIQQAQATLSYYNELEAYATATNEAEKASIASAAATASAVMKDLFDSRAYLNGNNPSLAGNAVLIGVFSIFFGIHFLYGFYVRQWWFMCSWSMGLILEIIGYAGRVWLSKNIESFNAYVMQLVCVTIAPCFLMAGIYFILAQVTVIIGLKYSLLKPMWYANLFIFCDVTSIVIQAVGGGIAAVDLGNYGSTDKGAHIMVAGLAFQVFSMALFQVFWYLFLFTAYRDYKQNGSKNFPPRYALIRGEKLFVPFLVAVSLSVIFVFVRSIYRLIELAEGFSSTLAVDEIYFMILEALMMCLAVLALTLIHPGYVYGRRSKIIVKGHVMYRYEEGLDTESEREFSDYEEEHDLKAKANKSSPKFKKMFSFKKKFSFKKTPESENLENVNQQMY